MAGSATSQHALREAGIEHAVAVVVAVDRDDSAVLATLTARELNPTAHISAAVREDENAHLLHEGGANSVITSSSAAGRLLGLATTAPDIARGARGPALGGRGARHRRAAGRRGGRRPPRGASLTQSVVAISRGGELLRFDDERAAELRPGDALVEVVSRR